MSDAPDVTVTVIAHDPAPAMAREFTWWSVWRTNRVGLEIAAIVVILVVTAVMFAVGWWPLGAAMAGLMALAALLAVATYVSTRRVLRLTYPVGSAAGVRYAAGSLTSVSGIGSQTLDTAALRKVIVLPNTVVLRFRAGQAMGVIPRELFDTVELEALQTAVAG